MDLLGLLLLVLSLIQSDVFKLRVFGVICCFFYIGYGLVINNMPMLYPNVIILAIHLYKLGVDYDYSNNARFRL